MCGIAGFVDFRASTTESNGTQALQRMSAAIAHRGPDDAGIWFDSHCGVFFAHRRLSIVDLSAAGHQPMISPGGRYVIVYNGEVYNHRDLRAELDAVSTIGWQGRSDTEVILAAFERWGIAATFPRLVGMFAMAIWDRSTRQITLVRDRAGEKPLYWGFVEHRLVFGSELKAIEGLDKSSLCTNQAALPSLLRYGYIPAPQSIYKGVEKLMPGTWLRFSREGAPSSRGTYWSAADAMTHGTKDPLRLSLAEATDQLESRLTESIARQLEADVPVGVFLSGGIDSSTVAALAQKCAISNIRTFTIGFDDQDFDESAHARLVAHHLGTDHTELRVTAQDALAQAPKMAEIFDEPFADSSQIPTFLLAQFTRQSVTVSLSGDGGDELFGGYPRYRRMQTLDRLFAWLPGKARGSLAALITAASPQTWTRLFALLGRSPSDHRTAGDSAHRVAEMLRTNRYLLYRYLSSVLPNISRLMPGVSEAPTIFDQAESWPTAGSAAELFMWLDFMSYLPDDVLTKVDRATMAVGLESRSPMLDHRVIEFSQRLPPPFKVSGKEQKRILRQVLYRHVPRGMIDRPKMGFCVPLSAWLRGPLRDWAEGLLFSMGPQSDMLDETELRRLWDQHQKGIRNWQNVFWTVLMLRGWQHSRTAIR